MKIRKMKIEDYEKVKELVYQVHKLHVDNRGDVYNDIDPMPLSVFKECINNKDSLNYVYIDDNIIKGIMMVTRIQTGSNPIIKKKDIYYIEDIVVDKKYRREGVGKSLYHFLKEKAKQDEIDAIELNVWAFNESALKFYESLGMSPKNLRLEYILKK